MLTMYAKAIRLILLPILVVTALPTGRDDVDDRSLHVEQVASNSLGTASMSFASPSDITAIESAALASFESVETIVGSSQTQFTAFFTLVSEVPYLEVSSIGGPAITLAPTGPLGGATTTFAGHAVTALPSHQNIAHTLAISRRLISGLVGAWLGAVVGGVVLLL
ncbi:hypothetical protein BD309DRAFT_950066 [Dichomitus squalens]|nr:hypothetical protein BD309DRAFT_950066 [Dichomitus squalens]